MPPSPTEEIRLLTLRPIRGANFWSPRPVTRLDLAVGAYDDISSADVPGFTDSLMAALPGLVEHRCSIGERGGFLTRLRRGTYAPHIIEHVGLELQVMIGHDVGFGRARGGDRPGEYTVVYEHLHAEVGLRAAALALQIVQHAFAGALDNVDYAVAELTALSGGPDIPIPDQHVVCGVTGGEARAVVRGELLRRGLERHARVVEVAPAYLLNAGLPYARSDTAIILDADPTDVPERYRDPERARQLASVLADAVPRGGIVIAPAGDNELHELILDARRKVAIFSDQERVTSHDSRIAHAIGFVHQNRIILECCGVATIGGEIHTNVPLPVQVAAALALFTLNVEPEALLRPGGAAASSAG